MNKQSGRNLMEGEVVDDVDVFEIVVNGKWKTIVASEDFMRRRERRPELRYHLPLKISTNCR